MAMRFAASILPPLESPVVPPSRATPAKYTPQRLRPTPSTGWYNGHLIAANASRYDGSMQPMREEPAVQTQRTDSRPPTAPLKRNGKPDPAEELEQARQRLDLARRRFYSAALGFCDGSISEGQLRAVRELLREQEDRLTRLGGETGPLHAAPFVKPAEPEAAPLVTAPIEAAPPEPVAPAAPPPAPITFTLDPADDLSQMLTTLDQKIAHLEQDLQQGHINASQYRAIHRHYVEQREVALRLRQAYPESDRWRVVLEEGKTTFLMQLNEAVCLGFALYDMSTRERVFVEGKLPPAAEEAMALLRTFGPIGTEASAGRMLATQSEDGSALLLIPGMFTAALVVFSQQPPGWQVRALREVHRNFETANRTPLTRGDHSSLIFPDLTRFIRE